MGNCICLDKKVDDCTLENTQEFSLRGRKMKAKVLEIYDGDTITIAFKFDSSFYKKRCRVYGIDCAELKTRDGEEKKVAIDTKLYVQSILLNKVVDIETDNKEDKYGRILAKIFMDDGKTSLADHLISKGMAYAYTGEKKKAFREWYKN